MTRSLLALLLTSSCLALAACASSSTPTGLPTQQSEPTVPGEAIPGATDDGTPQPATDAGSTSTSSSSSSSSGGSSSGSSSSGGSSSGGSSSGGSSSSSSGSSSGGSSSGSPPPPSVTEQCTPIGASCTNGGGMEYCITYTGGVCSKIVYKFAGKTYPCASGASCGSDCTPAYYAAYTACQGAVGACNQLAACCNSIANAYYPSCAQTYNTYVGQPYGDVSCKSTLDSYRASNLCP